MHTEKLIGSLDRFGHMLPEVVRGLPSDDARWKPDNGAWSILEVVCHLTDEEEFDFRKRVELTLKNPGQPWPSIDPEGWAIERQYNMRNMEDAVARFVSLRRESVAWLRALDDPDWSQTYQHPKFGAFQAGDIFAAWVAHDHLHLRQIAKRMFMMADRDSGDYSILYAGEWRA